MTYMMKIVKDASQNSIKKGGFILSMLSEPSPSTPFVYSDLCMLQRPEGTFQAALCFLSLHPVASLYEIVDVLHPEEQAYYRTLKFELRQRSYLLGRYAAKRAVSLLCDEKDLRRISIDQGIFNQPITRYPSASRKVQVSITHCDEIGAAIAFPEEHPMGIDIERIDTRHSKALESQVTANERVLAQSIIRPHEEFLTTLWTVREGLSKILRTGLTTPFHIFEVSKIDMRGIEGIFEFKHFAQYKAVSFNLGSYVLAIVCPKKTAMTIDINKIRKLVVNTIAHPLPTSSIAV